MRKTDFIVQTVSKVI